MNKTAKQIEKIITETHKEIKKLLSESFVNLQFFISSSGYVYAWIRSPVGAVVKFPYNLHISNLSSFWSELQEINREAFAAATLPTQYFWCSECSKSHTKDKFGGFVMAAAYCKECAKKPEIAQAIEESKKVGFYE